MEPTQLGELAKWRTFLTYHGSEGAAWETARSGELPIRDIIREILAPLVPAESNKVGNLVFREHTPFCDTQNIQEFGGHQAGEAYLMQGGASERLIGLLTRASPCSPLRSTSGMLGHVSIRDMQMSSHG
jgi:hypothetical protein